MMQDAPLFLPDRTLRQAAKTLGTPFVLYDAAGLRRRAGQARAAFGWSAGFSLRIPIWLNPNPTVLQVLRAAGCGVVCTTAAELRLAQRCGFAGAQVCYAPRLPDAAGEALAEALDAIFLIDDPALRPGYLPRQVLLRVCPGGKLLWRGRTAVQTEKSRCGMQPREAELLAAYYCVQGVETGLSLWLAENDAPPELYPAEALWMLDWMRAFRERTGQRLICCDLGPGPGIARRTGEQDADLAEIAAQVRACAGAETVRFSAAPGSWLMTGQGILLARAAMVRRRERPLVILDADCSVLPRFAAGYPIDVLGKRNTDVRRLCLCDVAGCGPDLRGRLAERCVLPPVSPGDLLAVRLVGASPCGDIPACLLNEDGEIIPASQLTEASPSK